MHILPISRTLKPKVDMKEIAERKRIATEYKKKLGRAATPQEQILFRSLVRMCEHPTQEILRDLNDENAILEFRHTFLSNFYAIPIEYKGVLYPSVEHAYQAQKFTPEILASVSTECLTEINETLRFRGRLRTFKDAGEIFTDETLSSGNVKVIADILRAHGYVRSDWDDDKLLLMAYLLQQKFRDAEMRRRLKETGDKYLVEGNTWNDTLWGVSGGRGRNLLGLMLMDVREQIRSGQRALE